MYIAPSFQIELGKVTGFSSAVVPAILNDRIDVGSILKVCGLLEVISFHVAHGASYTITETKSQPRYIVGCGGQILQPMLQASGFLA